MCFVQGQVQKSEQKHKTKSIDEFHNHSPLLTMIEIVRGRQRSRAFELATTTVQLLVRDGYLENMHR